MNAKTKTVEERQAKEKANLLENLKRMPIIQFAAEKSSVSRATYYRWRNESTEFKKAADMAIAEGEALITDMSETQLISLIRDKHFQALQLWLRHHHPKYTNTVELSGELVVKDEPLTPEQEAVLAETLRLGETINGIHEPE